MELLGKKGEIGLLAQAFDRCGCLVAKGGFAANSSLPRLKPGPAPARRIHPGLPDEKSVAARKETKI